MDKFLENSLVLPINFLRRKKDSDMWVDPVTGWYPCL